MADQLINKRGLLDVMTFVIPVQILDRTVAFLQHAGDAGVEGFVLWSGKATRVDVRFTSVIIPEQQAFQTDRGLLVTVDGDALFKVNRGVYERGEILAAQVHSHPTDAYHSDTDDHYPLVTLLGALSLVIPDFAMHAPGDIDRWAWYRLQEYGKWAQVGPETKVVFE